MKCALVLGASRVLSRERPLRVRGWVRSVELLRKMGVLKTLRALLPTPHTLLRHAGGASSSRRGGSASASGRGLALGATGAVAVRESPLRQLPPAFWGCLAEFARLPKTRSMFCTSGASAWRHG